MTELLKRPGQKPRFQKRLRLQTQLLIMLFGFGVVPMIIVVMSGYTVSRAAISGQARAALRELASRQATYLQTEIRREQLILRTIAGQIAPALGRGGGDLEALLAGSLADDGVFDGLRLLTDDHQLLADVELRETAPFWPDHLASPPKAGVTLHQVGDSVVAYLLTVPVTGSIPHRWLQGHVRAADFGKNFDVPLHLLGGVEIGVFDETDHVIIVPHEHAEAGLRGILPVTGAMRDEVIDADLGNEPALAYGTRLPELGWQLVAALPLSVVLEPVNRILWLTAVGTLVLTALIVVAGLAASRVVTTPLREVATAAASFGATGTYDTLRHPGVAETEALISAFQSMAENLKHSREEIGRLHDQEMERAQQLATVGELASGVAHEIRNPLTGILGAIQIIRKRIADPATAPILEEAETQLRRIDSTTSRLLEYARPPALRKAVVQVGEMIHRAARVVEPIAEKTGVRVECECADAEAPVHADPELIVQVLVNLLLNAIDVTAPDGMVRIEAASTGGRVEIRIIDHGPGIPPDQRSEIFRPFMTTKHQGTGLGLSISQQIVARHDGELRVDDAPAGGAVMVVSLPVVLESSS